MVKNSSVNAGDKRDTGLIPGLERSSGERNGNPRQYSCLENPRDRGACWAAVYGVAQSWTRLKRLSSSSSSSGKESACKAGDMGPIPGSGRSHGEGNGNPLQYSCLENSMDRKAWQATVHGVTKSRTRLGDSTATTIHLAHKAPFLVQRR